MTDLALSIILSGQDVSASSIVQSLGNTITSVLTGNIVQAAATASAALIGLGVASVKTAADFQQTMLQVQALAGVSASEAKAAEQAIMQMSVNVGQAPKTLAEGLYYIASAGYSAKESLNLLELSSKAASVGNTQTEVTANALTAALKAFNLPASEAGKVMDMMVKTVSTGKTEFDDYAKIIGKVSLNAQQAGVSFGEANAAFAILTNVMPSSKLAADSLNALLQTSSRFDLLTDRAGRLGIAFDTNAFKSMNLQQRMQYLMEITGGNTEAMTSLLGRSNAMAAATALASGNFANYNDALSKVMNNTNALKDAFEKTSSGFNASVERLKAAFDVLLITIGNALLPPLTALTNAITPVVAALANMGASGGAASQFLRDAFRGMEPVVVSVSALLTSIGNVLRTTVGPAFLTISQVVSNVANSAFSTLATQGLRGFAATMQQILPHVLSFAHTIGNAFSGFASFLQQNEGVFKAFANVLITSFGQGFGQVVDAILGLLPPVQQLAPTFQPFFSWLSSQMPNLLNFAHVVGNLIKQAFSQVAGNIPTVVTAFQGFLGAASSVWTVVQGQLFPALRNLWTSISPLVMAIAQFVGSLMSGIGAFAQWMVASGTLSAIWKVLATVIGVVISVISTVINAIAGALAPVIAQIVSTFQTQLLPAFSVLWQALQQLAPVFAAIGAVIGVVVMAIIGIVVSLVAGIAGALGGIISGIIRVVGGIIQVFSGVVAVISGIIGLIVNLFTGNFTGVQESLRTIWNGIVQIFSGAVQIVAGLIQGLVMGVVGLIGGFVSTIINFFTGLWNSLVGQSIVVDIVNGIIQLFTSFGPQAIAGVIAFIADLTTKFTQLATDAINWGKNLIQSFIDGVSSMASAVGEAASGIIAEVGKFLGFESPAQAGPGAQANTWAPNLIAMYASGLADGAKQIQAASEQLMIAMQLTFQTGFQQLNVIVQQAVLTMTQTLSFSWTSMITATQVGMLQMQLAISTSLQQTMLLFTTWWLQLLLLHQQQMIKLGAQLQLDWKKIQTDLLAILKLIETDIKKAWDAVLTYLKGQQKLIETAMTTPFKNAQTQIKSIMQQISSEVSSSVSTMISKLKSVESAASSAKAAVASVPSVPSGGPNVQSFAEGVENFGGGLAKVHKDELLVNLAPGTSVIPARNVSYGRVAQGGPITINYSPTFNVPGRGREEIRELAEEVNEILARDFKDLLATITTGGTSI